MIRTRRTRRALLALFCAAGTVNVADASSLYWDANGIAAGAGAAPSGTWGVNPFWNNQPDGTDGGGFGTTGPWAPGGTAVFAAGDDAVASYTVSVSSTQTVGGINVEEGNVTLAGGTIDMGSAAVPFDVAPAARATVTSVLGGAGARLSKTGDGTLVVGTVQNTPNTFDGGVSVSGGVLEFPGENSAVPGQLNALGKAPAAVVPAYVQLSSGGALRSTRISTGTFLIPNRGIQLGAGGGKIDVSDATPNNSLLYAGVISGAGSLTKVGAGTIQLQGVNTYSGDTFIAAGGLGLNATATLGDGVGTLHLEGGSLVAFATRAEANALPNPILISADSIIRNTSTHGSGVRLLPLKGPIGGSAGTLSIQNVGSGSAAFNVRLHADASDFSRPINIDRGSGANTTATLEVLTDDPAVTQTFSGVIAGNGSLLKDGPGTLLLSAADVDIGPIIVNEGMLVIGSSVLKTAALSVNSARVDVKDNKIITGDAVGTLAGSTYTAVTGLIQAGRNGGAWTGNGIVTSLTDATTGNFTSVGVATAQQVKGLSNPGDTAVWAGQTITDSDTLVMYTYGGDANLDGKINVDDYGHIDSSIPLGLTGWFNGDFSYDGKVNVDDYGIIDFNIGIQGAPFATEMAATPRVARLTPVPDPAGLSTGSIAALIVSSIRRSRRAGKPAKTN